MLAPTSHKLRGTQTAEALSSANPFAPAHAVDSTDEDEQSDTWSFDFEDAPSHIGPESQVSKGPKMSEQQPRPSLPIDKGSTDDFPARLSDQIADLQDSIGALRTSQKTFIESLKKLCDSLEEDFFAPQSCRDLLPFVVSINLQRLFGQLKAGVDEGTRDRAAIRFLDAFGSFDDSVLNELQIAVESAVSKQRSKKRSECNDSMRRISEAFAPLRSVEDGGLGTTTEDYSPGTAAYRGGAPLEGGSGRPKGQRSADKRSAKEGTRKPHRTSATHSSEGRRRASGKHDSAYDITQQSESEGSDRFFEISQSSTERERKLRAKERLRAKKEAELAEREARLATVDEREGYRAEQVDTAKVRRHSSSHRKDPSDREYLPLRRRHRRDSTNPEAYIQESDWQKFHSGGRS